MIEFDNNVGGGGGETQSIQYPANPGIETYALDGEQMNLTEDGYILPSDNRLSLTSTYGDSETPIIPCQI